MEEETNLNVSCGPLQEDVELNINVQDELGNTRLHKAIEGNQEAVFDALLLKNVDIEIKNNKGETPLIVAVKSLNEVFVEKLIKKGANIDSEGEYYITPLVQAILLKLENVVDLLLKNGASCCVKYENFKNPLIVAIQMNLESIFDKLIEAGADVKIANRFPETPLQAALTAGNLRIARKLLALGATLSPYSVVSSLLDCDKKNFAILIDFILKVGFDVNTKGCENWTLLHLAVLRSNQEVVEILLKKGADLNAKDEIGQTPLLCAVMSSYRGGSEIVRLLLNAGASIYFTENLGVGPSPNSITRWSSKTVKSYLLVAIKMELAKVRININPYCVEELGRPANFPAFEAYRESCREEVMQMKAKKFNSISLYYIFSECNDPLFASSSDMEAYVNSDILEKNFPIYAVLLRKMFREGKERNILLDHISISVGIMKCLDVTHLVLPRELSRKVLVCLEDCDLLNVKRAYDIINNID